MHGDLVSRHDAGLGPANVLTIADEPGSFEYGLETGMLFRDAGEHGPDGRAGRRHFPIDRGETDRLASRREE